MRNHQKPLLRFLPSLLPLLLAVGSATLCSACGPKEDGTWMRCHSAQVSITLLSSGLTFLLLLQAFVPRKGVRALLNAAVFAGCLFLFLIPGTLQPLCMMHTMRCYTVMQPFVRIMAVLTAAVSLFLLVKALKGRAES